tara:strand:+ start:1300 stop:4134 length:2835 start_codon:yes stop_codon:yes gene_type:complete
MADFNEPQLSSTYTTFLTDLKNRDTDLAAMFAPDSTSTSNYPARAVRFNTTSNKFQRRNSGNTGFEDLTSNHHFPAITIDGSGDLDVGGDITTNSINVTGLVSGGRINATGTTPTQTGLYRPATNTLGITTNTALRWTIDSSGRLFNNGQATHQGHADSDLQIYSTAGGRIDLLREDATVTAGNGIGQIIGYTNETADSSFSDCAKIQFISDGTFSNTSHPTRIHFQTTIATSTTPRTVGCFDQNGFLAVGEGVGAAPSYPLHVNGGTTNNTAFFKSTDANMFIGLADDASGGDFNNRIAAIGNEIQIRSNGNATPHVVFADTGKILIRKTSAGLTASATNQQANLQVYGTAGDGSFSVSRGSGNSSPPSINLYKYRTTGYSHSQTAVVGDAFGDINWYASDGTEMLNVCRFRVNSFATDFSGNTTAVSTGAIPTGMNLRVRNNDGGNITFFQVDHNGHIRLTPHAQPSGAPQNAYFLDIRANNTNGTGNFLRFTETDTTISSGRFIGGIQFASADANAQNSGLLGEIRVSAESGNPVHGIMHFRMAGTEHITIEGLDNHIGIHRSDPEFPLDVAGNALFDGSVCISTARSGFIDANDSAALQVTGSSNASSMVNITRFGDNAGNYPTLVFTKNHNTSASGNTACPDDSILGAVEFQGTRGSDFGVGSRIFAKTAAAFASDPSPIRTTDLHFQVANGNTLTAFMCLTNQGCLNVGDGGIDADYSTDADTRLAVIDGSGPSILLHRRDSSVAGSNQIGSLICADSDGGLPAPASAEIQFIASQNHSASAKGTDIKLRMCQNNSNTLTSRFTFRDSGAFGVNGDDAGSSGECLISKGNAPPEYQPVAAKAWVNFNGDNFNMDRNYNVSSVTDNGTGIYTINWDNDFGNNNYAMAISVSYSNHIANDGHGVGYIFSQSNGNAVIRVNSEDNGAALMDKDIVNAVAFH